MTNTRYKVEIKPLSVQSMMNTYTKLCIVVVDTEKNMDVAQYLNTPTGISLWRAEQLIKRLNRLNT